MTPLREYIELDISIDIREKTRVSDVFMDQCHKQHVKTCTLVYMSIYAVEVVIFNV